MASLLFSPSTQEPFAVISIPMADDDTPQTAVSKATEILDYFPGGINVVGASAPTASDAGRLVSALAAAFPSAHIAAVAAAGNGWTGSHYKTNSPISLTPLPSSLLHLRWKISLTLDISNEVEIDETCDKLSSSKNVFFVLTNAAGNPREEGGLLSSASTDLGLKFSTKQPASAKKQQQDKVAADASATLDISNVMAIWRESMPAVGTAVTFCYDATPSQKVQIHLDVVSAVKSDEPIGPSIAGLQEKAVRQLHAIVAAVKKNEQAVPKPYHFYVGGKLPIVVSRLVLDGAEHEKQDAAARLHLHSLLSLDDSSPLFRKSQSLSYSLPIDRLKNVHVTLAPPRVGTVHAVQGDYLYYHYKQDKFDDAGWGCAYRSLQTLMSWFRLQHYTSVPNPSLREIQQTLVKIGDKPSKFYGTRDWIGATEVSMVLDELLGVSSKIMHLSSGDAIAENGRALAAHFDTQGTPIMVGGGELAYTLLGIDYNEATGEMMLLILDPHYVGADELRPIQEKKWVGWHPISKLRSDVFYNLCMPQRPKTV